MIERKQVWACEFILTAACLAQDALHEMGGSRSQEYQQTKKRDQFK